MFKKKLIIDWDRFDKLDFICTSFDSKKAIHCSLPFSVLILSLDPNICASSPMLRTSPHCKYLLMTRYAWKLPLSPGIRLTCSSCRRFCQEVLQADGFFTVGYTWRGTPRCFEIFDELRNVWSLGLLNFHSRKWRDEVKRVAKSKNYFKYLRLSFTICKKIWNASILIIVWM